MVVAAADREDEASARSLLCAGIAATVSIAPKRKPRRVAWGTKVRASAFENSSSSRRRTRPGVEARYQWDAELARGSGHHNRSGRSTEQGPNGQLREAQAFRDARGSIPTRMGMTPSMPTDATAAPGTPCRQ